MGKKIRVQRRGRGTSTFRAATRLKTAPAKYPLQSKKNGKEAIQGKITHIFHESGRGTPLASVRLNDGQMYHTILPEGVYEGQSIELGSQAKVNIGNVLPLGKIPEGTIICNVELSPGDGGKIARSSGTYLTIIAHTPEGTIVRLPSKRTRYLNDNCRATIGVISGAGRIEKPFLKAGSMFHLMRAKGHVYPRTRGVAMVAASHPYGSSKRGARKVTTVSRRMPPGRKVGLIAARRTGRGRKKRRR
jgi:large subunit ribosomal protein L2